ncbi:MULTISPECIES: NADH:ubiquinone reductase (Na(+)-transporting) subunit F [unclassified Candidatus Frackibacter]|uniref:NADH:ubiquinone reductase (Na(+)-transporting) subunit F n=1 Tax=unclassified Candidatus Frackibacter TaxID=2648818 RepID=UPI0007968A43|nr:MULTISPECIES: 2Fe-2S iron-sulfur cluster binding domain-containing protein [unclassified Candidatus Frackibacter]KXS41325.1 MAG: Na+-transporting NADH:ubiquinone oxidoreductase subunit F [Candidatus Frackibacter sp. T328-2]SDC44972.1 Na+-transporting NADH:ubiquinone oxidoreductase subunit F [Candidatus Frackibacter sp. WG11]SEM64920.1 Na+-transporting NADH:ubiquinone oxidoreductase subunit F [Candidatus Frackibacter sp. WG12]SFL67527.1 Na+-transporting NADH:ubiquinone oxidoreductase subunit 
MNLQPIYVLASIFVGVAAVLAIADYLLTSQEQMMITVNDEEYIPVAGSGNLLNILSDNEIHIPAACGGKAACGHCKVEVKEGGGEMLPTEEAFISPEEEERGVRLACQVKVSEDMKIEVAQELLDVQEYTAEVEVLKDVTPTVKHVRLKMIEPTEIEFKAGQYAQLLIPGFEVFRAYSIASPPSMARDENALQFTIKLVPGGLCTSWIHFALEEGDTVKFTGPYGHFYLDEESDREIILIGGGAGMAPMRGILERLDELGMPRPTRYYFGARNSDELYYEDRFAELEEKYDNFEYIPALSDPTPDDKENWDGPFGFVTDVLDEREGSLENAESYLCGPPVMLDAAERILVDHGMPAEKVMFDKF